MSVVMANTSNSQTPSTPDTMTLVQQMREDGLALKKYVHIMCVIFYVIVITLALHLQLRIDRKSVV